MIAMWGGFIAFVLIILALDLGVFNRTPHAPSIRQALGFAAATAVLALMFAGFVYHAYTNHWAGLGLATDGIDGRLNDGRLASVKFLTGYVIEMSLSMDNVFVIALIFGAIRVPAANQHRVLFWGVLGALAMRGAMIAGGAALVERYHWVLYVMGAFLVVTAVRMLLEKDGEGAPDQSRLVRFLNKNFRVTKKFTADVFASPATARTGLRRCS